MSRGVKLILIAVAIILGTFYASSMFYVMYAAGVFFKDIDFTVIFLDCDTYISATDGEIVISPVQYFDKEQEITYQYEAPEIYKDPKYQWNKDVISKDYVVLNIQCGMMHSAYLKQHELDVLLYLNNDTGCADVVYECIGYNRILFAYDNVVAIYNGERNSMQYIQLETDKILHEVPLDLDQTWSDYCVRVDLSAGMITITKSRQIFPNQSFTLPIWRE